MKNLHLLYFTAQPNPFQSIISYLVCDIYNKITKAFSIDTAILAKYIYAYIPFFSPWLSRRSNKLTDESPVLLSRCTHSECSVHRCSSKQELQPRRAWCSGTVQETASTLNIKKNRCGLLLKNNQITTTHSQWSHNRAIVTDHINSHNSSYL